MGVGGELGGGGEVSSRLDQGEECMRMLVQKCQYTNELSHGGSARSGVDIRDRDTQARDARDAGLKKAQAHAALYDSLESRVGFGAGGVAGDGESEVARGWGNGTRFDGGSGSGRQDVLQRRGGGGGGRREAIEGGREAGDEVTANGLSRLKPSIHTLSSVGKGGGGGSGSGGGGNRIMKSPSGRVMDAALGIEKPSDGNGGNFRGRGDEEGRIVMSDAARQLLLS